MIPESIGDTRNIISIFIISKDYEDKKYRVCGFSAKKENKDLIQREIDKFNALPFKHAVMRISCYNLIREIINMECELIEKIGYRHCFSCAIPDIDDYTENTL